MSEMQKYHEELQKAGVLLDASGLKPSSKGWRVKYSAANVPWSTDPLAEAKELIAGYTIIQMKSREEAMEMGAALSQPLHRRQGGRNRGPAVLRAGGLRSGP